MNNAQVVAVAAWLAGLSGRVSATGGWQFGSGEDGNADQGYRTRKDKMISKLHLKNFIAFTDQNINFSPGINVVIGENGTGNTAFKDIPHEAHS